MRAILGIAFVGLWAYGTATTVWADCSIFPELDAQCRAQRAERAREERRSLEERRREDSQQRREYERYRWEQRQRESDREALREAACLHRGGRWTYGQCIVN